MHSFSLPSDEISPLVKRIYEVDLPQASTFEENRIIPLGTGTITFLTKGNPRFMHKEDILKVPEYILSGQYFPSFSFECDTALQFYGIALKPTASYKLFDIYLADIQNSFLSLNEVIGEKADKIQSKLVETEATEKRFEILDNFIVNSMPDEISYSHIDVLVDHIYEKKGIIKVRELSDYADVSRRYIEKKFKKIIGFSPGQFIRQVRFNFTCAAIAEGKLPVNDILVKFGYYDRSHFMKKFKKYHSDDLSVLTSEDDTLFSFIFSRIMRSDNENSYHP